ncbi:restriction endonuclease subunit S [Nocardioides sp.]|uniref:restriction endonuclease subunit S n=1 Tax=Nocardioides sp. TaxID=35761 RepID=UPI00262BC84B|nr:restriction endonuclease subunit S [Nocardioides sp.]
MPKDSRSDNFNRTPESLNAYQLVQPGDLVVNRMKAWQGSLGVSSHRGIVSPDYEILRPTTADADPPYLHWLLRSRPLIDQYGMRSTGIRPSQWRLYWDQMKTIEVVLPPLTEQRAIADYLDHETGQIDTLIAKQEQLIATLRERRSSLVDQVLLQDDIERVPLRRVADVIDCAHVTATFVDDDRSYPVASIRECQGKVVDLSSCRHTTRDFYDLLRAGGREPRIGDLLFVRNVSVGLVSVVAPGTRDFAVGQETVLLRRTGEINTDYLRYALTTSVVRYEIEGRMIGSTFRRINVPAIRTLPIPLPPPAEQRRAVEHLDEQTSKIDVLIAKAERFIELSKERRTALITAAVTGQIDVRASA